MKQEFEQPSEIEISAVLHRADGTVVDLGVVDAAYTNPAKQAIWRLVRKPLTDARIRAANRKVQR